MRQEGSRRIQIQSGKMRVCMWTSARISMVIKMEILPFCMVKGMVALRKIVLIRGLHIFGF